jgi:hypothetical protein
MATSAARIPAVVSSEPRVWPALAQVFGVIVALGFAFFLARIPVQVSDSLGNLIKVSSTSWTQLLQDQFTSQAFFRPLLLAQTKALLDISHGHSFVAFRAFQVAQVFVCLWLFVRLLQVRTANQMAAAAVAVVALTGSHTFAGTIREAYPINNYMTIVLCCLVVLNIQMSTRSRWYGDVLVLASLALALGTVETGLLVWGCLLTGFIGGWRGISRWALLVATLLVVGYFGARLLVLNVGMPSLIERSSGFGFQRLEPSELTQRFGASPWHFYAYNVLSSLATVLFSEPRAGVWLLLRGWQAGDVEPAIYINVIASTLATILIVWFAATSRWRQKPADWSHGQRLVVIAAATIAANAGISYPYTKDPIMSIGGMTFAAALFAAASELVFERRRGLAAAVASMLLVIVSATWSWRVLGLQHNLVHTAFTQRNDWAGMDLWVKGHPESQRDRTTADLVESLRMRALKGRVPNPHVEPSSFERYFDHYTD